jgi:Fungal protein kinase
MLTLAVLGHYHLWAGGVEHNDISVNNLMYDKHNGRGVVNDFDLSHLHGLPRPSGNEHTGTMPFMALDLLTDEAWEGKVARLYRHDCESFAWVLLWICCRYGNGKEIDDPPLNELITHDYNECLQKKNNIFELLRLIRPTPSYEVFWEVSRELVKLALNARRRYIERRSNLDISRDEPSMAKILQQCRQVLVETGFPDVL